MASSILYYVVTATIRMNDDTILSICYSSIWIHRLKFNWLRIHRKALLWFHSLATSWHSSFLHHLNKASQSCYSLSLMQHLPSQYTGQQMLAGTEYNPVICHHLQTNMQTVYILGAVIRVAQFLYEPNWGTKLRWVWNVFTTIEKCDVAKSRLRFREWPTLLIFITNFCVHHFLMDTFVSCTLRE